MMEYCGIYKLFILLEYKTILKICFIYDIFIVSQKILENKELKLFLKL